MEYGFRPYIPRRWPISAMMEARVSAADDLSGAIVLLSTRLDRSGPSTDLALRPQEGLIVLIPS